MDEAGQTLARAAMDDCSGRIPHSSGHHFHTLQCEWFLRRCALQWSLEKVRHYFENQKESPTEEANPVFGEANTKVNRIQQHYVLVMPLALKLCFQRMCTHTYIHSLLSAFLLFFNPG